ncbi:MAG: trigger factor [Bacteroidia bacterium]|nr:trigger factor [Bacteroidia bacterium]
MDITRENKDGLNAVLRIKVGKEDYAPRVDNVLKDYRKKAKLDGFRPGMVPTGLIRKMFGKHVLLEELNKIVTESLSKYITDEKLHLLGDPLPGKEEHSPLDLDNQTEFEFTFDLGIAPELKLDLSHNTEYPYYKIKVEEKAIDDQVSRYTNRFSTLSKIEEVIEKAMLKGDIAQIDDQGKIMEGGILKENATLSATVIKDEDIKKKFIGAKVGASIDFNIRKAFQNFTEISSMLGIKKEEAETLDSDFSYTIKEISEFVPHEVNEELFNKVFGDSVITEEEFRNKIMEEIEKFYFRESDFRFLMDVKEGMIHAAAVELPDEFLKRWMVFTNKKLTAEKVEKAYPLFTNDLKWQLIKDKIIRENEIKVEEDEVIEVAKESIVQQFRQYGIMNLPEEHLANYAKETLKKEEEKRKFFEKKFEEKVLQHIRNSVKINEKEVTPEEFNKLFTTDSDLDHEHEHEQEHKVES